MFGNLQKINSVVFVCLFYIKCEQYLDSKLTVFTLNIVKATVPDVSFERMCDKQMVTVCKPQTHGYGYNKG